VEVISVEELVFVVEGLVVGKLVIEGFFVGLFLFDAAPTRAPRVENLFIVV
jgi:hypothetical protein